MFVDVALTTIGLYGAGGLGAAQYIGVYTIVPITRPSSSRRAASVLATVFATVSYLAVVALQLAHRLPFTQQPLPDAWLIAAFNLLVLNIVGSLAALLAEAYQASRQRLTRLYDELERAHDESLKLNVEIPGRRPPLRPGRGRGRRHARGAQRAPGPPSATFWLARRTGRPLSPEAASHLDQAEQACESAMRIVRTTLDMARRPAPEREPVAPADVVRQVAELKAVEFRRDGITLDIDAPRHAAGRAGFALSVLQVLLNVVGNAQDELRHSARPAADHEFTGRAADGGSSSRCATAAPASRPTCCRTSSSRSTRPRWGAPASASPSRRHRGRLRRHPHRREPARGRRRLSHHAARRRGRSRPPERRIFFCATPAHAVK